MCISVAVFWLFCVETLAYSCGFWNGLYIEVSLGASPQFPVHSLFSLVTVKRMRGNGPGGKREWASFSSFYSFSSKSLFLVVGQALQREAQGWVG